jgi:hypothetical protein
VVLDEYHPAYDKEVAGVVEQTAKYVHGKYERFIELPDLMQEAYLIAATKHDLNTEDYGLLAYRLERDLMNHCEKAFTTPRNDSNGEVARPDHSAIARTGTITIDAEGNKSYAPNNVPHEEYLEAEDEERIDLYPEHVPGGYTEDDVKFLLPAVWDESYAYSLPERDDAPEKGMPRAASNKARSNSHWAFIADIKTGWNKTDLTRPERRALLMRYGLAWPQRDIAFHEGVTQQAISTRLKGAITKITARLNGVPVTEED